MTSAQYRGGYLCGFSLPVMDPSELPLGHHLMISVVAEPFPDFSSVDGIVGGKNIVLTDGLSEQCYYKIIL